MIGMHGGFDFDLDLDPIVFTEGDDDPAPDTVPSSGSASLHVEDKSMALFTSCEWSIVAKVIGTRGTELIGESSAAQRPHSDPFVKRWTRQLIRTNKERLRRLGVDVSATYVLWGGTLEDLNS